MTPDLSASNKVVHFSNPVSVQLLRSCRRGKNEEASGFAPQASMAASSKRFICLQHKKHQENLQFQRTYTHVYVSKEFAIPFFWLIIRQPAGGSWLRVTDSVQVSSDCVLCCSNISAICYRTSTNRYSSSHLQRTITVVETMQCLVNLAQYACTLSLV